MCGHHFLYQAPCTSLQYHCVLTYFFLRIWMSNYICHPMIICHLMIANLPPNTTIDLNIQIKFFKKNKKKQKIIKSCKPNIGLYCEYWKSAMIQHLHLANSRDTHSAWTEHTAGPMMPRYPCLLGGQVKWPVVSYTGQISVRIAELHKGSHAPSFPSGLE